MTPTTYSKRVATCQAGMGVAVGPVVGIDDLAHVGQAAGPFRRTARYTPAFIAGLRAAR